jgi:hypothetical protein
MLKGLAVLLTITWVGSSSLVAQNDYSSQFARALEQRLQREHEAQMQQQRLDAEREAQDKNLALQRERQQQNGQVSPSFVADFNAALPGFLMRHPDINTFQSEMIRLAGIFKPGDSPQTTGETYLEGLYTLAKYASFSAVATKPREQGDPLDNAGVVGMVVSGMKEDTLLYVINLRPAHYSLAPSDRAVLHAAGVTDAVIQAMADKAAASK